jgi:hypothetical protein
MSMLLQVHARHALYGCVVGRAVHDRALHMSGCNCCELVGMKLRGKGRTLRQRCALLHCSDPAL